MYMARPQRSFYTVERGRCSIIIMAVAIGPVPDAVRRAIGPAVTNLCRVHYSLVPSPFSPKCTKVNWGGGADDMADCDTNQRTTNDMADCDTNQRC